MRIFFASLVFLWTGHALALDVEQSTGMTGFFTARPGGQRHLIRILAGGSDGSQVKVLFSVLH